MKARLVRDAQQANPAYSRAAAAAAKERGERYDVPRLLPIAKGAVIDHPDAWKLIGTGMAIPADEECARRAGLSDDEIQAAINGANRMETEDLANPDGGADEEADEPADEE